MQNEILLVAESVSGEKGLSKEVIFKQSFMLSKSDTTT